MAALLASTLHSVSFFMFVLVTSSHCHRLLMYQYQPMLTRNLVQVRQVTVAALRFRRIARSPGKHSAFTPD